MNKVCPLMSMRIKFNAESASGNSIPNVFEGKIQHCMERDCALWVVEMGESKMPIEKCGLIK